tara:strand:- start:3208 stop:4110 length:903 start_codon:yes stop_codon:yes gene_type:complete
MSNEVSIFQNQTGVSTRRTSALAEQLKGSSTIYSRRIQTSNKGFFRKIINGEQVGEPIRDEFEAIIVNMLPKVSRIYYKDKFDPNKEATLPNCWSNQGDKPEAGALDKQHSNCADCPMNVKGSGDNGGKACRFQRRIAIMLAGDTSGDIYQFNIPAKSLFGKGSGNEHPFESYIKFLLSNREAPDTVMTKISYDLDADSMELLFTPVRSLTDEEFDLVSSVQTAPEAVAYTKITVAQTDGVTKAPKIEAPKPSVTRSEEPEEEESEEVDEPVKRTKKKEEPTASSSDSLASVIDAWKKED